MQAPPVHERLAFAPPPQPGLLRAFLLAVVAHLLLLAALMHGLQWKRDAQDVAAEAELWSAVPQQAAPREVVAPPPPPPPPVVAPPIVRAPPLPDPQVQRDAAIALEREKKQQREEARREAAEKREAAERRKAELDRDKQRKAEALRKREEAEERKQEQARAVAEARRKEEDKKRKQEAEAKRQEAEAKKVAKLREENLKRMQGMAGSGSPSATGAAAQSSGPSAGWASRVQARVRPNIVFSDDFSGNPVADVEVRTSPDGTIVSKRLVKSSGLKAWDEAVLRALDKTEVLPRDTDGRVPSPVVISFRPRG